MSRWIWVVLLAALAACTGSRTLIGEQADPSLTGEDDAARTGIEGADDGMGFLDDVVPDDEQTDDEPGQSSGSTGDAASDPFADFFGQGAAGAGSNPFADFFGGNSGSSGGSAGDNPFADFFGGNSGDGDGDSSAGDGDGDGDGDSQDGGGTDSAPADPFQQLINFFLELLAAFLGGGA